MSSSTSKDDVGSAQPRARPPLGWGVVGASSIAREWMIPAINSLPDGRVVAVTGGDSARVRRYAEREGIPTAYDTLDDVLSDPAIDIVYVSTTNERHHGPTLAAARAGKHVLCEKPLALRVTDAREMVEGCRQAGVILGTNHHRRNAVSHRALRRLVAEGAIGVPLAARVFHAVGLPPHLQGWRIDRPEAGGGVALDITVHDTDTLRFILADEVREVTAYAANQGLASPGLNDAIMGVMRFRSGLIAQFHDAFTIRHAGNGLEIHGTDGSLTARDVMTQQPISGIVLRDDDGERVIDPGPAENLYQRSVRRYTDAVHGIGAPAATGDDGVRSLAIALAAQESAATGRTATVIYD